MQLRKIVKNRGHFPSDEVASKLLYLALRNIERLEDATDYVEAGSQSVRHLVRRTLHERIALSLFNPTSAHKTSNTSIRIRLKGSINTCPATF